MAQNKITTEQAKAIGIIAIAAVIAIGLFVGGRKLFGLFDKSQAEKDREKDQKSQLEKEAKEALKTSKLTRKPSEYASAADTIYKSLNRASIDDDANAAELAFTSIINSEADLAELKRIYGTRPLYNFGFEVGSFDLISTLSREFSDGRKKDTINILAKKGVNISL